MPLCLLIFALYDCHNPRCSTAVPSRPFHLARNIYVAELPGQSIRIVTNIDLLSNFQGSNTNLHKNPSSCMPLSIGTSQAVNDKLMTIIVV